MLVSGVKGCSRLVQGSLCAVDKKFRQVHGWSKAGLEKAPGTNG